MYDQFCISFEERILFLAVGLISSNSDRYSFAHGESDERNPGTRDIKTINLFIKVLFFFVRHNS